MKPKEFDELIRQKFDQNDFEYNPRNWERLEEQMDGRAKKRSILMWWLMPVAGVAASVALAMGVPYMLRHSGNGNSGMDAGIAKNHTIIHTPVVHPAQDVTTGLTIVSAQNDAQQNKTAKKQHTRHIAKPQQEQPAKEEKFAINYFNAVRENVPAKQKANINLLNGSTTVATVAKKEEHAKKVAANDVVSTFKPEKEQKQPKMSVMVSGGYSKGNQNNGYAAGAAIRKNVSRKVFVEGSVGYASNNIAQDMPYRDSWQKIHYWQGGHEIAPPLGMGKVSAVGSAAGREITTTYTTEYSNVMYNHVSYSLSYIQLHPSVGYKLLKHVSLVAGPDFQQVITDNRPAPSETNPGINRKAPLFDMGLMGKTEISVTKTVKAAVAYRKGINNVLTPMNKFVDRDYMQFEVKCAIFNK